MSRGTDIRFQNSSHRRNARIIYNDGAFFANQTTFCNACSFPSFRRESKQQVQSGRPCRVSAVLAYLQEGVAELGESVLSGLWTQMTKELNLDELRSTMQVTPPLRSVLPYSTHRVHLHRLQRRNSENERSDFESGLPA